MKKLSIIIPHKNSIVSIERLINSIPKREDFEIIVVDDHSEKENREKLYELAMNIPEMIVIENSTNTFSAGKARNLGLDIAKGRLIMFADADDYFQDSFEYEFEQVYEKDFDIVIYRPYINGELQIGKHLENVFDRYFENPNVETKRHLLLQFVAPWSKIFNRSFIEVNGFKFDEVMKNNDVMFSKKTAIHARNIIIKNQSIYYYDIYENSITNKKTLESYYSQIDVNSRSVIYQRKYFSSSELMRTNPEVFFIPYRLLLKGIWEYKDITIIIKTLKIFHKNGLFRIKYFHPIEAVKGYFLTKKMYS